MPTCEYCKREQSKFQIGRHQPNCPEKPENREKILRNLEDPQNPGYALSERRYVAETGNSPCANTLMKHFGKWSDVATAHGLELMSGNERRLADKMEATGALLRRLSQELHNGQYGPSLHEYEQELYGGRSGAMEKSGLYRRFGGWAGTLQHFGLPAAPPNGQSSLRPVTAAKEDDEQWLRHRATYVPVQVTFPPWSLKYGFGTAAGTD